MLAAVTLCLAACTGGADRPAPSGSAGRTTPARDPAGVAVTATGPVRLLGPVAAPPPLDDVIVDQGTSAPLPDGPERQRLSAQAADVAVALLRLCDAAGVDLVEAVRARTTAERP